MKRFGELIFVAVVAAALTLGAVWGHGWYQDYTDPDTHIQNSAMEINGELAEINAKIQDLYRFQIAHKIQVKEQIAVIVPKELLKPKAQPQKTPAPVQPLTQPR